MTQFYQHFLVALLMGFGEIKHEKWLYQCFRHFFEAFSYHAQRCTVLSNIC